MSVALLDHVVEAQAVLIAALDSGRVESIESATATLAAALERVRGADAWHPAPGDTDRVGYALRQTEAARTRVNYLADGTRQRLDRIAVSRRTGSAATYTRRGMARFSL